MLIDSFADRIKHTLSVAVMGIPPWLRRPYAMALSWGKTIASLGLYPHLALYELKADEFSDGLTAAYLGPGANLALISSLIHGNVPDLTPIARKRFFNLSATIRQLWKTYDLVIVELPFRVLRFLSTGAGIVTSPYVDWQIDTQRSWDGVQDGFHRTSKRRLYRRRIEMPDENGIDRFFNYYREKSNL